MDSTLYPGLYNTPVVSPIEAVEGIVEMINVSQILPNLFVGSFPQSLQDIDRLKEDFGVTAVLSVQTDEDLEYLGVNWHRLESYYREVGIEVRRVPVRDFDPDDLQRKLPRCVEVLGDLLTQGNSVYVHCNMAVNRSPSIVIAYLHWTEGWSLERAVDHVMNCRPCDPYLGAIRLAGEDRPQT